MASTTFDKPLDTEVDSLREQIGKLDGLEVQTISTPDNGVALSDIPANYIGRTRLNATDSPTGASIIGNIISFGSNKTTRDIIFCGIQSSAFKVWVYHYGSSGVLGWYLLSSTKL